LWQRLLALVEEVVADSAVTAVGVGCGGPMEWPDGIVSPLNIPAWNAFPLRERLQSRYENARVRVHNDAVAMAIGEHWRGAGRGTGALLGVVVSTGVGGGVLLGGRPVDGATGNAGHVGHVVVEPGGRPCTCGGRGCVETVAAGPALVRWAQANGWLASGGAGGQELAAAAAAGDAVAAQAFRRGAVALAMAIASTAAVCDLDVVVIGGGIGRSGAVLFEPLRSALASYARLDFLDGLRIVPAELGADAGLVGAAAFARRG
jgi:glucokinase